MVTASNLFPGQSFPKQWLSNALFRSDKKYLYQTYPTPHNFLQTAIFSLPLMGNVFFLPLSQESQERRAPQEILAMRGRWGPLETQVKKINVDLDLFQFIFQYINNYTVKWMSVKEAWCCFHVCISLYSWVYLKLQKVTAYTMKASWTYQCIFIVIVRPEFSTFSVFNMQHVFLPHCDVCSAATSPNFTTVTLSPQLTCSRDIILNILTWKN